MKILDLPEYEGDFAERKKELQKKSQAISKHKYYLKRKFAEQKNLEELQNRLKESQKKIELNKWSELQHKISSELDEQIKTVRINTNK